jgi:uncharacterized protein (DUF1330 family)
VLLQRHLPKPLKQAEAEADASIHHFSGTYIARDRKLISFSGNVSAN